MAEELQHLIEKIESEAIHKAEAEADAIRTKAKEKAAAIVKEAEAKADALLAQADKDAQEFTTRSKQTLEQAGRDLLIAVGQGVQNILDDLVGDVLDEAMDIKVVQEMLTHMAESYIQHDGQARRIDLLVTPAEQETLVKFFADRYRQKLGESIDIHPDRALTKGFRIAFKDEHAHHDFSKEAIAEALCNFLRPHLAEIIMRAAQNDDASSPADK